MAGVGAAGIGVVVGGVVVDFMSSGVLASFRTDTAGEATPLVFVPEDDTVAAGGGKVIRAIGVCGGGSIQVDMGLDSALLALLLGCCWCCGGIVE